MVSKDRIAVAALPSILASALLGLKGVGNDDNDGDNGDNEEDDDDDDDDAMMITSTASKM